MVGAFEQCTISHGAICNICRYNAGLERNQINNKGNVSGTWSFINSARYYLIGTVKNAVFKNLLKTLANMVTSCDRHKILLMTFHLQCLAFHPIIGHSVISVCAISGKVGSTGKQKQNRANPVLMPGEIIFSHMNYHIFNFVTVQHECFSPKIRLYLTCIFCKFIVRGEMGVTRLLKKTGF